MNISIEIYNREHNIIQCSSHSVLFVLLDKISLSFALYLYLLQRDNKLEFK